MKVRIALYCLLGAIPLLAGALGTGGLGWWWLSGIFLAASLVPVAGFGPRGVLRQLGIITPILMVITVVCTCSEAFLFLPTPEMQQHPFRLVLGAAVIYLMAAVSLAIAASVLKLSSVTPENRTFRSLPGTLAMLLLSGVAYAVYYYVFGGITFQLFTKGYYPDAIKVVEKLGLWFWGIQIARGMLMAIAVLPLIRTLRLPRWETAIAAGIVVWVAGGLAPLLLPNPQMSMAQRMIHVVEIFTQNFPLGVTAALLLRRKEIPERAPVTMTAAAKS
jgi:hypothetical protein